MKCKAAFFGMEKLPRLDIDEETLKELAKDAASKGLTVAGVQKKLSLHLKEDSAARLTLVGYPAGYILKPQANEYPQLPEVEDLTMDMASATGIKVVPHGLIEMEGGSLAYITKRIDRIDNRKLAMEDFCQLNGRLTENKYKSSYEQCAKVINKYSDRPGLDMSEFFLRLVFCFVTGNSDMHLKNFALIEDEDGSGLYSLSAAYDLLSVNIVNPSDSEQTALTLCGKKNNLHRDDFLQFAAGISLTPKTANTMLKKVISCEAKYYEMIDKSYLSGELKEEYKELIRERIVLIR